MAQILDPLPPDQSGRTLCCYINATSKIQVARICDVPNWYFERVVFPGQRLVFEAPLKAHLEIHTGMMATAILSDTIPCDRLVIHDDVNYAALTNTETNTGDINHTMRMSSMSHKTEDSTKPLTAIAFNIT